METYTLASSRSSKAITDTFSTSFGLATKLFDKSIRADIYNIYGMVRVADEIVDSYGGQDMLELLDAYEEEIYASLPRKYSTDVVIHAFVQTAVKYGITQKLIKPFFASMRTDIDTSSHTQASYKRYIHGSAEVVGLMCLRVFTLGNSRYYDTLEPGAAALGAAFQKVNFLRDMAADWQDLQRYYFPFGSFEDFDGSMKQLVIADIEADFALAEEAIERLPENSRVAVTAACNYYQSLLKKLEKAPLDAIKSSRIRVNNFQKLTKMAWLVIKQPFRY